MPAIVPPQYVQGLARMARQTGATAGLWVIACLAQAEVIRGYVTAVTDGDTIKVVTEDRAYKVRLAGIDAPEMRQRYGAESRQALVELVGGQRVLVTFSKTDRYLRVIGTVELGGIDTGLALVRSGWAWHYKKYQREQAPEARDQYARAETEARSSHRGLWRDEVPVAPWNFRHPERSK